MKLSLTFIASGAKILLMMGGGDKAATFLKSGLFILPSLIENLSIVRLELWRAYFNYEKLRLRGSNH
jgi:hypothetical protein